MKTLKKALTLCSNWLNETIAPELNGYTRYGINENQFQLYFYKKEIKKMYECRAHNIGGGKWEIALLRYSYGGNLRPLQVSRRSPQNQQ